ncbi:MAG: ACT domain-containing protein [Ruminococcaceae bacterium]|nr:ACT domain-containing protein [Oscillospiraceae bacterium]
MRAIITVVGCDKVGIIYEVSKVLAENDVNILDISQTIMQDMFTMIMLVSIDKTKVQVSELSSVLDGVGEKIGVSIKIQHEDLFNSMHRI